MASPRLESLALSERGFLFDPATGHTYSLNPTAAFLLKLLVADTPRDALAAALVERFETDEDTASRDAEQFLMQLREMGLLE